MVEGQTIQLADRMSESLVHQEGSHGLLGLAFSSLNTVTPQPAMTPLDNMISQKDIPAAQSLFTAYLGSYKDVNDPDKGQSFFTFGGIDQQVVESTGQQITYVPVDAYRGFWEFSSPSFGIDGNIVSLADNTAIADTGTTLLLVSDYVCQVIYANIPGAVYSKEASGWLIPNGIALEQLPSISFALGDKQFVVEKEHLLYAAAEAADTPIPGMAYGGIQSRGSLPFDIWGDTILKCIYAVSGSHKHCSYNTDMFRFLMLAINSLVRFSALTPHRTQTHEHCNFMIPRQGYFNSCRHTEGNRSFSYHEPPEPVTV